MQTKGKMHTADQRKNTDSIQTTDDCKLQTTNLLDDDDVCPSLAKKTIAKYTLTVLFP